MAPLASMADYNSTEVVFHYTISSILLIYLNTDPKLTQHKDLCLEKMLQTLKLLVFDVVSNIYVVFTINMVPKIWRPFTLDGDVKTNYIATLKVEGLSGNYYCLEVLFSGNPAWTEHPI